MVSLFAMEILGMNSLEDDPTASQALANIAKREQVPTSCSQRDCDKRGGGGAAGGIVEDKLDLQYLYCICKEGRNDFKIIILYHFELITEVQISYQSFSFQFRRLKLIFFTESTPDKEHSIIGCSDSVCMRGLYFHLKCIGFLGSSNHPVDTWPLHECHVDGAVI